MKRVLFICYYFPPFGGGGTFRAAKFAKYLPDFGWEPTVLTVRPKAIWAEDASLLDEISARIVRTDSFNPIGTFRELKDRWKGLPAPAVDALKWAFVDMADALMVPDVRLGWVPYAVAKGIQLHREQPFDLIFTNSPPHSTHFAGLALKRILNRPWVADFKDGWLFCPFMQERPAARERLEKKLERTLSAAPDELVTVSEPLKDYFGQFRKTSAHCIPNGYDEADFSAEPKEFDRITIGYFGSIFGATLDPELFLSAVTEFLRRRPELKEKMQVLFYGPKDGAMFERMRAHDLPLVFEHYVPHREAVASMLGCNAVLVLVNDISASQGVITGKVFEYLRSGVPVIALCPRSGALWQLIEGFENVFPAEPGDVEGIVAALERVTSMEKNRAARVPGPIEKFSRRNLTGELAAVFDACIGNR